MARGDITIRAELRPCKVNLGARDGKAHIVNALFHGWNHYSKVIEPSPMVGGSPGGQVSSTFAIVELENGKIRQVETYNIQFTDNPFSEYAWPEKAKQRG